jgi:dolichyl-phosphate beta-glucosyltransferase
MPRSTKSANFTSRAGLQFWLGFIGLAIAVGIVAAAWPFWPVESFEITAFAGWMTASVCGGFVFRGLRRKLFFAERLSLHKAFSFDALFQAAILVNPQLRYPDVEREFLASHLNTAPDVVSPWFVVRETSAAAIPLVLAGVTAILAGNWVFATASAVAASAWIGFRTVSPFLKATPRGRFLGAIALGITASVVEGLAFMQASQIVYPQTPAWGTFLLYAFMLAAFELSPLPFALGTIELTWAALAAGIGGSIPGLLMPEMYRMFRAVPVLLLMLFYLPRYKMSAGDLYDARLATVLARTRRRPGLDKEAGASSRPLLSVVIPAYNESERLPRYLPDVVAFCQTLDGGAEVIVVDDGSKDGTAEYVAAVATAEPMVRLIRQNPNRGKGAAVRSGVLESGGRFILFTDADGATPITECSKLLEAALAGSDVVIGSRKIGGEAARRERSILRKLVGSIFYRITNLLAVPGIEDTQCGFKLFSRAAARQIFPDLRETGWAFDVEILFLAQKIGLTIDELPVNWSAVEGSKIRPKDAIRMLVALIRIRRRGAGLTTGPAMPR